MIECIKVGPPTGDDRVVLVAREDGDGYNWPSKRIAVLRHLGRPDWFSAWTDDRVVSVGENYPTPEAAAIHLGARLPDAAKVDLPDLDTPAATDQPTARERELAAQVEAQALQLRRYESAREAAIADATNIYRRAAAHFGADRQYRKVTEEVAEFLVAMEHFRDGKALMGDVLCEAADAVVTIQQVVLLAGFDPGALDVMVGVKVNNLRRLLEEAGA